MCRVFSHVTSVPKQEKIYFVFLRNYFEFAGSAPYAHKCGVLCFELYFERMPFLPFLFYSPYAGFCKNCIRRHVKPESSSVQVCPKCFRCPRSIRIINPQKSVVKHLGAQNFDNSMKTRWKICAFVVNYGTPIKQTLFLSLLQGFQQNESVRCSAVVRCAAWKLLYVP